MATAYLFVTMHLYNHMTTLSVDNNLRCVSNPHESSIIYGSKLMKILCSDVYCVHIIIACKIVPAVSFIRLICILQSGHQGDFIFTNFAILHLKVPEIHNYSFTIVS